MDDNTIPIIETINDSLLKLSAGKIEEALIGLKKLSPDFVNTPLLTSLVSQFTLFIHQYQEGSDFINALSEGNLDYEPPHHNYLISNFKQLQSNLRHLTWQTQQIASGDYNQHVSYLGEFSVAFNQLIDALREKKKMADQLYELSATRDKFMSIISHDLRSPFTGILGFSDLLAKDYDDLTDNERKLFITNIQNSAHNAFKLLENLLEWSRMQTGKIQFYPEMINLQQAVLETFFLLQPIADKKEIHLLSEVPPDIMVYADSNSLLTIIRNLISNALKFTHSEGKIRVLACLDGYFTKVSIRDTGVGIKPENLAKLFRLDEQFKSDGTNNEKGTGLGLLLCKEFVEKNGGRINATSELGIGSNFSFILPSTLTSIQS